MIRKNKAADDDNMDLIIKLSAKVIWIIILYLVNYYKKGCARTTF
jgi:hypothetical protein